ncbi:cysteine-rich venom protein-like [Amphiura filiformis]|uniref:cysteine-rich venom protein-like n=1 Tax=Amphiura filiformis TaxID=82378 RepID=UPI003B20EDC4
MAFWCAIVAVAFCVTQHIHRPEASPILPRFQQRHAIVDTHNALRRKMALRWPSRAMASNMKKMKWDLSLAIQATIEATCDKLDQYLASTSDSDYTMTSPTDSSSFSSPVSYNNDYVLDQPTIGKTIAYTHNRNIKHMIQSWFIQKKNYKFHERICKDGKSCDNFLQLAWAEADRVGCSYNAACTHQGKRVKFLVCLYNVPIIEGEDPYKVGRACTKCPSSTGFCEDGLCVPTCRGSTGKFCACKKRCHHHGIGKGKLNKDQCSCTCLTGMGPDCEEECQNPMYYEDWDICADDNTEESCKENQEWQKTWCPANCKYGCKKYNSR